MPKQEQRRSKGIAPHNLTPGVRRVWVVCAMPQLLYPPTQGKRPGTPFDGRLGGPPDWSGCIWKLSPLLSFE